MFGSQSQQTLAVASSPTLAQSTGDAHGQTGHDEKVNDETAELAIIEQVDNSGGVGIYYDEVDEFHLAQEAMN
jgi:hypothetical protein